MGNRCERCMSKFRQVVQTPFGAIVQDWHAQVGEPSRSVAEIDPDICDVCEDDVIAACDRYEEQTTA